VELNAVAELAVVLEALQPPLLGLTEIVNQSPQLQQFTARDIRVN